MPVIGAYIHMGVEGPHEIIGVHRGRGAILGYIGGLLELHNRSVGWLDQPISPCK